MIKEIKALEKKYNKIAKNSEYVSVGEILNDFYHLKQDVRLKRVPKNQRWKIVNIGIISVGKLAGIWGFVIWPGIGVKIIKDGFQKRKIGKSVIGFWNFFSDWNIELVELNAGLNWGNYYMKTVKVHYHCCYCKFKTEVEVKTNQYGFFVFPAAYCPNDFYLLSWGIEEEEKDSGSLVENENNQN